MFMVYYIHLVQKANTGKGVSWSAQLLEVHPSAAGRRAATQRLNNKSEKQGLCTQGAPQQHSILVLWLRETPLPGLSLPDNPNIIPKRHLWKTYSLPWGKLRKVLTQGQQAQNWQTAQWEKLNEQHELDLTMLLQIGDWRAGGKRGTY